MATYRQDAAPQGGYKAIEWARYYGKKPNGLKILGVILAMKGLGLTWLYVLRQRLKLEQYEEADWRISLMPFYLAENDRAKLKTYRAMRAQEEEVMKDMPDWKVGTWKGLELYHDQQRKFDENLYMEDKVFRKPLSYIGHIRNWISPNKKEEL